MNNFLKPEILVKTDPFEVDHKNPNNFRSLNGMYFGAKVEEMLHSDSEYQWESQKDLDHIKKQFLAFYVELCSQVKCRINHKDDLLSNL